MKTRLTICIYLHPGCILTCAKPKRCQKAKSVSKGHWIVRPCLASQCNFSQLASSTSHSLPYDKQASLCQRGGSASVRGHAVALDRRALHWCFGRVTCLHFWYKFNMVQYVDCQLQNGSLDCLPPASRLQTPQTHAWHQQSKLHTFIKQAAFASLFLTWSLSIKECLILFNEEIVRCTTLRDAILKCWLSHSFRGVMASC